MKKVVADFIKKEFGCETGYSGSVRVLYIKGEKKDEALRAVRDKWPTLAFYVRKVEEIPAEALETAQLVNLTAEAAKSFVADNVIDVKREAAFDNAEKVDDTIAEAVLTEVDSKDAALELRAKVDEYLIKYQNNKNEKGFYTAAATFLGTNSEYVRDRYRKLKKKNLIEINSLTPQTA